MSDQPVVLYDVADRDARQKADEGIRTLDLRHGKATL